MSEFIEQCSDELKRLNADYFYQDISREEYVALRTELLDTLEQQCTAATGDEQQEAQVRDGIVARLADIFKSRPD